MAVSKSVSTLSDGVCFCKDSGLWYEWQWWSLWRSLLLSPCCASLFLVKLQVCTINGSDGVCDGAFFHLHAVSISFFHLLFPSPCVFSKASCLYHKWQWWSLWRSSFLSLCYSSLFLVKLQVRLLSYTSFFRRAIKNLLWLINLKRGGVHSFQWKQFLLVEAIVFIDFVVFKDQLIVISGYL